jgi:hypothetical protein
LSPGFCTVGIISSDKGILITAICLSIQVAISTPSDIDSTIATCGYGPGIIITSGSEQFSPGFCAIGIVFSDKGILTTAIRLSIQVVTSIPSDIDSTIATCGYGKSNIITSASEQFSPNDLWHIVYFLWAWAWELRAMLLKAVITVKKVRRLRLIIFL